MLVISYIIIFLAAGSNDPLVNPVTAGRTQQRQPSQHSRCRTLVQSGNQQPWLSEEILFFNCFVFQVAYKKFLIEKYENDTKAAK